MKTQYVIQVESKTRWAWELYRTTLQSAVETRKRWLKDKTLKSLRAWKEEIDADGTIRRAEF